MHVNVQSVNDGDVSSIKNSSMPFAIVMSAPFKMKFIAGIGVYVGNNVNLVEQSIGVWVMV